MLPLPGVALKAGESAQTHIQDILGLLGGELKALAPALCFGAEQIHEFSKIGRGEIDSLEAVERFFTGARAADQLDDTIDDRKRGDATQYGATPIACLTQIKARPAPYGQAAEIQPFIKYIGQAHFARNAPTIKQGEIEADPGAHISLGLEDPVDIFRICAGAQFHYKAWPLSVGFVACGDNIRHLAIIDHRVDLAQKVRAGPAPGHVSIDDDRIAAILFEVSGCLDGEGAPAGFIGLANTLIANDPSPGRKIRPRADLHQGIKRAFRIPQAQKRCINHLAEIMGWNRRGHADGDAGATIDKHVGKGCRQHHGLFVGAIIVWSEIDRVAVDFLKQEA